MTRQFSDLQLGSLELFCLAAEHNSFTAAAQVAGLTPAAVSRGIARLEQRLGNRLFIRTTRQIRLSEAGRSYYRECRAALQQLGEAERQLAGQQLQPSGLLRLSLPTSYGERRILPLLPRFQQRYPQLQLELQLSNHNIDFTRDDFDLAIRARAQPDSSLIARKLEDAELVVVAAPDYLARHGTPQTPEELGAHPCIRFLLPRTGRSVPWSFRRDGQEFELQPDGHFACSDDLQAGVSLARHAGGLYQCYRFMVEDELRSGQLRTLLDDFGGCSRPFSLIYPQQRQPSLRLRVLVDFLLTELTPIGKAPLPRLD